MEEESLGGRCRFVWGHTELEWSVLPGRQVQVWALSFRSVWLVKWGGGDELFQPHLEKGEH